MGFQVNNTEHRKRHHNGGGRAPRPVEEKYRLWLIGRVSQADWEMIVDVAKSRAKCGDDRARQWLSDWCMGKPVERTEHTGAEGEALTVIIQQYDDPGH